MARYSYRGTKITGTSTAGKVFKKSGIKSASKGQTYFNKSTGHVYKCTKGGKASEAKWKYLRTDIAKKPKLAVTYLSAPARQSGNRKMKSTWKTPAALVDKKKGNRATDLVINWYLGIAGKDPRKVIRTTNEKTTESTVDLDYLTIGRKTYRRSDFYPFNGKPKLNYVTIIVTSKNSKGGGAYAKNTRNFYAPRKPTISAFSFNSETGETSCTITTDAGTDHQERYDTRYQMTVYYSETEETKVIYDSSTTATSYTLTFDDPDYASRSYEDFAKVTVKAWARGYKGNSAVVEKTFYVSYPAKATIENIEISDKTSSGKCTVYVDTHHTTEHPVDRIKLEYLANSEYATAESIPSGAGWENSDIIDDAQCTALAVPVPDLIPNRGNYTWIRLKTYHANEAVLYRYSEYRRVEVLETPAATAADDKIKITSAAAGGDGKSAVVALAWDDGDLPSTGTELSWDEEEDTWKSTKEPKSFSFEWEDKDSQGNPIPVTDEGVTYPHSATITIKELDEGEKYYVRARRYSDGDETTYSEYSNMVTVVTSERPETVGAVADRYVPRGSGLNVYWTFSGNGLQKEWQIVDDNDTVLVSGEGSIGATQIPAERLEAFAVNGSVTFTVQVSTGSGYVISDQKVVTIIDKPEIAIASSSLVSNQLRTNNLSVTLESNKVCDVKVIVTSQGASGQFPQGVLRQTAGDTIHSGLYTTEWTEEQDGFSTIIELPTALDFWDNGAYTLAVTAIDRQTGLVSDSVSMNFTVAWAHQAPSIEPTEVYTLSVDTEVVDDKNYYSYDSETQTYTVVETEGTENPSEEGWYEVTITRYVTLTPIDETDDNGFHHQAVQINLTPPPNAATDDVYDIYRLTGDGAQLIGQSFPQTYVATDEYAPFGDDLTNHYRIAVRTADGDISFSDIEYVLDGDSIRLDWAEGFIEYPYSVDIGDSYKKDVDVRKHLDGSIGAYWNQGVERNGSLNTDAIKILQQDDIDRTRQVARYTGPVFVRTREGTAFEADVQISNLNTKNIAVMSIAIDATEVDLTEEFMLPTPFQMVDETEPESGGE